MIDLSKYEDKSFYDLATHSYKKFNDNSFKFFRKYKKHNSSEDRLIFLPPKNDVYLNWGERANIVKKYEKNRKAAITANNGDDQFISYSAYDVKRLTPKHEKGVISQILNKRPFSDFLFERLGLDVSQNKVLGVDTVNIYTDYTNKYFSPLKLTF
jgi:hypothetical protein